MNTSIRSRFVALAPPALAVAAALCAGGCNILGAVNHFNYTLVDPWIPEPLQKAQYTLPPGRTLVWVDSDGDLDLDAPELPELVQKRTLAELSKNLPKAEFVSSEETLSVRGRLSRRAGKYRYREVANRTGADTVLLIQLEGYRKGSVEEGDQRLTSVQALVQVLDARDERVLWPEGNPFTPLPVSTGRYNPAEERENGSRLMAKAADKVSGVAAKLFYDWQPKKRDIGDAPE
jgi:hypothetical protein